MKPRVRVRIRERSTHRRVCRCRVPFSDVIKHSMNTIRYATLKDYDLAKDGLDRIEKTVSWLEDCLKKKLDFIRYLHSSTKRYLEERNWFMVETGVEAIATELIREACK